MKKFSDNLLYRAFLFFAKISCYKAIRLNRLFDERRCIAWDETQNRLNCIS